MSLAVYFNVCKWLRREVPSINRALLKGDMCALSFRFFSKVTFVQMKLFHEIKNLVFNLQGKQIHHSLCSTSANSHVNDGFTAVLKKLQLMANKPFILLQASWLKSTCTILYSRKRTIKIDAGRILWCPILMFSLFSFLSMPIEMWAGNFCAIFHEIELSISSRSSDPFAY